MGSFRRAFFGYRRGEVDAAVAAHEARIGELERELSCLSGMVLEREREIRDLHEELREANERHDQSVRSLEAVSRRLDEIHAQARGQATRIRMKALREAVEVSRRVQELAGRVGIEPVALSGSNGADPVPGGNGEPRRTAEELFQGLVEVEVGPLGDFAQLVGFEDAAGKIDATSEISVRKFSEGRATLSMRLDEPVELLRELEENAPFEFKVRKAGQGRVVLDVGEDEAEAGPEQQAA
ncbi:MAG: hypothetical protein AABM29_08975 [Actinomycetota bacterium]